MIVVTGAVGFIGSCLVSKLNQEGYNHLILVDDFSKIEKAGNLKNKSYAEKIERSVFIDWLKQHAEEVDFIYHIGARTDTTEFNKAIFDELNVQYTQAIWTVCVNRQIPLVYASSAATYGLGEFGYKDDEALIPSLKPLNPYGDSKNDFDKWAITQKQKPPFWAGLKFFNVYGPNEYHKARMASVVFHAFNQINATGGMKLFRSHRPDFKDGQQLRDFVYIKDVVDVLYFMMTVKPASGIYNLGTGQARSFLDLTKATFKAMHKPENISFTDTPEDIRDKYQYFTEADMNKLRKAGYTKAFTSLENGITDYVSNYLTPKQYY